MFIYYFELQSFLKASCSPLLLAKALPDQAFREKKGKDAVQNSVTSLGAKDSFLPSPGGD